MTLFTTLCALLFSLAPLSIVQADPAPTGLEGASKGIGFSSEKRASDLTPHVMLGFSLPVNAKDVGAHCAYFKLQNTGVKSDVKVSSKLVSFDRYPKIQEKMKREISKSRLLIVRPSAPLDWGSRWEFSCASELTARDRSATLKSFSATSFETLPALTAYISLSDRTTHVKQDAKIYINFSQEVLTSDVLERCVYLNLETKKRTQVKLRREAERSEAKRRFSLQAKTPLSSDARFSFSCDGIKSHLHKVPTLGVSKEFKTYPKLWFLEAEYQKRAVPDRTSRVSLKFTNQLSNPYLITSTPAIPNLADECHASYYSSTLTCDLNLKPLQTYQFSVAAEQTDIYGQKLGHTKTLTIETQDNLPAIALETGYYVAELERPVFPVWSQNTQRVTLTVAEVTPEQFYALQPKLNWWSDSPLNLHELDLSLSRIKYDTPSAPNEWKQHLIDPAKLLHRPTRSGMYYVEVSSDEVKSEGRSAHHRKALVNFTDLGVVSKIAQAQGLVWVTRLSTGASLAGAKVSVRNGLGEVVWRGITDQNGVVSLPPQDELQHPQELIERDKSQLRLTGDDQAKRKQLAQHETWLRRRSLKRDELHIFASFEGDWTMVNPARSGSLTTSNFNVSVDYNDSPVHLRGFLHTDRGLYQPGETVHIKGLARESRRGGALTPPRDTHAEIMIQDPRMKEIKKIKAEVSPFGGFWFDFKLPEDSKLGDYRLYAQLEYGSFSKSFSVEKFKPASFEVKGRALTDSIERTGELRAEINAQYLYGAPLREGSVKLSVYSRPKKVSFKSFKEYSFNDLMRLSDYHSSYSDQRLISSQKLALSPMGVSAASLSINEASQINSDADLLMRFDVSSPSNEVISKRVVVPFFRYSSYIGLLRGESFVESGAPHSIKLVSVTPQGARTSSKAEVIVTRPQWNCVWEDWGYRGSYKCQKEIIEVLKQSVSIQSGQPTELTFTPSQGGEYHIKVEGESGHITSHNIYAWGGATSYPSEDSMTFEILSSKDSYEVGEEALLILKTDLTQAKGLVSIERKGVIETWPIEITPTTQYVKIPIKEAYAPNVYVSVALVQPRTGPGERAQPRMRMGIKTLNVRSDQSRLKVSVSSDRPKYQPGEEVTATVKVRDAAGQPVHAEVALTAADEGVLSLINFKTPDPLPVFYSPWGLGTDAATQYAYIKTIPSPNLERPATGGDSGGLGTLRSRFLASAIWKPGLVTDERGEVKVSFKAPDNLTAFRMMAVAADRGERFGSGDERFKVALPLQIHRSLPRFLSLGDQARVGVVVHNETGADGEATVRLILDEKLTGRDSAQRGRELTRTIKVKSGGRVPVLFDVDAVSLGESALTFSASLNQHRDAARFTVPIYHPSPLESHEIGAGSSQGREVQFKIRTPLGTIPESAVVSVSLDPHGLAGIERGLKELIRYPYGCLEQTTSKLIPMVATRDLAESLKLEGLSGDQLDHFVAEGVKRIKRHQLRSGGFSLWPGGEAHTYYTAYALWGLYHARRAGHQELIGEDTIKSALRYLRAHTQPSTQRSYQDERHELGVQAFTLYVRSLFNDADPQAAVRMSERFSQLSVYGQSYLIQALSSSLGPQDAKVQALLKVLKERVESAKLRRELLDLDAESAWYMSDRVRSTAAALDALLTADAESSLIPYLVSRLMSERRAQPQLSTQANLYSLLALTRYANTLKFKTVKVNVKLDGETIIDQALEGSHSFLVSSRDLRGAKTLTISSDQRVYYRADLELRRKPERLKEKSATHFSVKRSYLDESGAPQSTFKVGDVVTVQLSLPLDHWVNHLMLSDHIPAGFEVLNTKFKTVGERSGDTSGPFFREIHAERVDFASEYLWKREHVVQYKMRAIAEGTFALPPARAELMYEPAEVAQTSYRALSVLPK